MLEDRGGLHYRVPWSVARADSFLPAELNEPILPVTIAAQ